MPELTEITFLMLAALGMGLVFLRFKQPPLVGYIVAGVLLGPSLFGLIENREGVHLLAELGVLMLLFLMGAELSLEAFRMVWVRATSFVLLHLLCTLGVVSGIAWFLDWSFPAMFLVSCAMSLSSTAVAIKILESIHELRTDVGRLTVAILIAQDLAVIPILLWIKSLASHVPAQVLWAKMMLSIGLLAGLMMFLSRRGTLKLPLRTWIQSHPELVIFASLGGCFGSAALSALLGLSPAYGAFLGGLILGNTGFRASLIHATQTFQALLMMIFFVSIGLLLDLGFMWAHLGRMFVFLMLITVGKGLLNVGLCHLLKVPPSVAFLSGLSLAQMGEFSFVLANTGRSLNIVTVQDTQLLISLTVLSLMTAPLWLSVARHIENNIQHQGFSFTSILHMFYPHQTLEVMHRIFLRAHSLFQKLRP